MKVTVTICSKHKDERPELLSATERYTGAHIQKAKEIAAEQSVPFYILSGMFGLISANTLIPYYDYYLEEGVIDSLAELIAEQIQKERITEIDFYAEEKESWEPYKKAMQKGVALAGITLTEHRLY